MVICGVHVLSHMLIPKKQIIAVVVLNLNISMQLKPEMVLRNLTAIVVV